MIIEYNCSQLIFQKCTWFSKLILSSFNYYLKKAGDIFSSHTDKIHQFVESF
nr:MAG TPA: hypothetical protein [Caudoviricetes sp.]DAP21162.1 MAG TPA: hypothetical protein [Caudoviricetes sp.]